MSTGLPPIPLQQYAVDLSGAVARQDGGIAAAILNLQDRVAVERIYQGLPYATSRSFTDSPHLQEIKRIFVSSQLDGSGQTAWSLIASKHIAAVVHLAQAPPSADVSAAGQQHYQKAFDAQLDLSKYGSLPSKKHFLKPNIFHQDFSGLVPRYESSFNYMGITCAVLLMQGSKIVGHQCQPRIVMNLSGIILKNPLIPGR